MSATAKRRVVTIAKSVLHVVMYILLGLILAFLINSTAQAAELDDLEAAEYAHDYEEESEYEEYENDEHHEDSEPLIPEAEPIQEQAPALGRLLVTSQAHGANDLLQGVVFEVHRAIDDVFMAQIATNQFGEAAVNLAPGDYFLREITAPSGFIANPVRVSARIQADRLREINIVHQPLAPVQEAEPILPENIPDGRLLITNQEQQSRRTGAPLADAMFEVCTIMEDFLIAQLKTNQFGEAAVNLAPGDYYIRQIAPSVGFILDSSRINIRIAPGELHAVTIFNAAKEIAEETITAAAAPQSVPADGRLLVTLTSGASGERLPHGSITVHDMMTDALIAALYSDNFGEASVFLPAGRYFLRQAEMPQGYLPNFDRAPFTVAAGDITDVTLVIRAEPIPVTPPPAVAEVILDDEPSGQGRIEIVTRAAGSGNALSGGIYAVHRASDSRRMAEVTTEIDGMVCLDVEAGLYFIRELRPTLGFSLETEHIFLEVGADEIVTVEITKQQAANTPHLPPPDDDGVGFIYITQTGQALPALHYIGGCLLIAAAAVIAGLILREFLSNKKAKRRAKNGKISS